MKWALFLGFQISVFAFLMVYVLKALAWGRQAPQGTARSRKCPPALLCRAAGDIILLRRLLRVNDVLWVGEWVFHVSLLLVLLRHLRYFLEPVPDCIAALAIPGVVAAWLLPAALVYILAMKLFIEKRAYASTYNFFLLALILLMSVSGLLMKYIFRADLVEVKYFALGLVTFQAHLPPGSLLFLLHFIVFLVLLASMPSHVFAAPLTMLEARQRDEELPYLMHEEK